MFSARTAMYLTGVRSENGKLKDGGVEKQMILTVSVQPFTREMANDLKIGSHLFNAAAGLPHDDLVGIRLAVAEPRQCVTFYRAPDPEMPVSIQLRNVKILSPIAIRRDKETPQLAASFDLNCGVPDPGPLHAFFTARHEQWFVTFVAEQGDMLDDVEDARPTMKRGKGKKKPAEQAAVEQPTLEVAAEAEAVTVQ